MLANKLKASNSKTNQTHSLYQIMNLQLESALKTEAVGLHMKLYIVCIESILCIYCL